MLNFILDELKKANIPGAVYELRYNGVFINVDWQPERGNLRGVCALYQSEYSKSGEIPPEHIIIATGTTQMLRVIPLGHPNALNLIVEAVKEFVRFTANVHDINYRYIQPNAKPDS